MKTPDTKNRPGGRLSVTKSRPRKINKSPGQYRPTRAERKIADDLMYKDLHASGISRAQVRKIGCASKTQVETKKETGEYRYSYTWNYADIDGNDTTYCRYKFTSEPLGAFGIVRKKPRKYCQLKGTTSRFYLSRPVDWDPLRDDAEEPLALTEGEKSTDAMNLKGIPCIGVSGVWAWRSKKQGIAAIKDFDLFKWKNRKVWLVFDNDLMTNPLVIGALAALSNELHKRGAKVIIKYLPPGKKNKGADDYLLRHDAKAFLKLREEPYAASEHLWQLNDRLAYIGKVNATWDFKYKTMYRTTALLVQQFSDLIYDEPKANGEGFKTVNAADAWTKWENRRRYDDIGYFPGDDPVVTVEGVDIINTWPGWKCEPKPGDVKPFLELLDYLFEGEPELLRWFWQWLAYPLQNPGEKCLNAVLLHSTYQGVGKSFIGYIMSEIYGDNFNVVSLDELQSAFNDWVVFKQFILGEEITGNNSRREADRLKNMFTREKLNVNIKFQPGYVLSDCANYLLTSNHIDALFLESSDRRVAVHEITAKKKSDAFYKRVDRWRYSKAGPPALFHYLLNVDLDGFNPKSAPPPTAAKVAMINFSKSELDLFAEKLRDDPNDALRFGAKIVDGDIFTIDQLTSFAKGSLDGKHHSKVAVGKALRRAEFRGQDVNVNQSTKQLYAIRRRDYWDKRKFSEWAEHWLEMNSMPGDQDRQREKIR